MIRSGNSGGRRAAIAVAATAVTILAMTGCSALTPGGGGSAHVSRGSALTSDQVRALGKVTLHMVDSDTGSTGIGGALTKDVAAFEKAYPNVTVVRTSKAYGDYGKTITLDLSAKDAPDIALSDVATAPRLVRAKLVRPMDDYYKSYKWAKEYPSSISSQLKLDSSGKNFGTGSYWGLSLGGELVGVYYNAALLKSLGLHKPATFAEFESDLSAAKAHGVVPIALGNLEQYPATHILSTILNEYQAPHKTIDWVNGKAGSTFETPGVKSALSTLQDWAKKGYIPAQANGTKTDDVAVSFAKGTGLFNITGTWRESQFDSGLGEDGGFMLIPPTTAGADPDATGAIADAFTISSKTKHADLAAFFLNYLFGPECSSTNLAGGYLPFGGTAKPIGGPISRDVLAAWNVVTHDDGLVGYLDSTSPTMGDTLFPAVQSLLGQKQTPEQVARSVQTTWAEYHSGA